MDEAAASQPGARRGSTVINHSNRTRRFDRLPDEHGCGTFSSHELRDEFHGRSTCDGVCHQDLRIDSLAVPMII